MYETLGGIRTRRVGHGHHRDAALLRIDRGELFELLADHTDLLQGIFSMLLRSTVADASADKRSGKMISNTVSTP